MNARDVSLLGSTSSARFSTLHPGLATSARGIIQRDDPAEIAILLAQLRRLAAAEKTPEPAVGKQPEPNSENRKQEVKAGSDGNKTRRRKRGRQPDTDAKKDGKVFEAWETGQYTTYAALGEAMAMTKREIKLALDRHRKRKPRGNK